ncbi:MAG: cupin domain-containing protein [Bacteroidales bacterium]|nr:cupin domain-containing protein [Bacteroidales bacterium]
MGKIRIQNLTDSEVQNKGIRNWPIWEKEVSRFDWKYDSTEECLIIEGEAIVTTEEGEVIIKSGDFVTFIEGLQCVWDVKQPIQKHYNFK